MVQCVIYDREEGRREGIGNSVEGRDIIAFKGKQRERNNRSQGIRRRRRNRGESKSEFAHFNISLLTYSMT